MIYTKYIFLMLCGLSAGVAMADSSQHRSTIPVILWEGQVRYSGAVVAAPCVVNLVSRNQQIDMGTVRRNQFNDIGSWADPRPFTIELEGCDTNLVKSVGVLFKGVTDGKDPQVFKTGINDKDSHGVGLGIFDEKGELMIPNSVPQIFEPLYVGNNSLSFTAKYRATDRNVTPGNANAWVNFFLVYP